MRRPLPDAQETARILGTKRTRPGKGVDGLKARWREVVGDRLAARTEPSKLVKPRTGGPASLELRVDGPSAALIQHAAPEILQRVNLFLGPGAVDKLRIVQGPVRPPAARATGGAPASGLKRSRAPLDAALETRLQADLAQAPDGPLKAALLRLGREVLRRG